jgi:hypothetical protein
MRVYITGDTDITFNNDVAGKSCSNIDIACGLVEGKCLIDISKIPWGYIRWGWFSHKNTH